MWRREEKPERARETPDEITPATVDSNVTMSRGLVTQAEDLGGLSPLISYRDVAESGIDVSKAHPGSLPQFITGRSTLLSNLYRDEVGLRIARLAAERITAKNTELRATRGIDAVHLAVGLAQWRIGGQAYSAPVLLRPLAIRRHHNDFELRLEGSFIVNPELVRVLKEQLGLGIDPHRLAALAYDDGIFKPQPVIDQLRTLTASIDTFAVRPRLVISTFADVQTGISRDLSSTDHALLRILIGEQGGFESYVTGSNAPRPPRPDDRAPASDQLLLDADAEQEDIVWRVANGESLVVATLPGTGGTQTVINAIGELVRAGKRVLVVSARRSTLDGVRHRLAGVGLEGLAVSPRRARNDLVRAIVRNEKAVAPKTGDVDDALVRLRALLRDYRQSLRGSLSGTDASVLDATRELARLASLPVPPATTVRLSATALSRLAGGREEAARLLTSAARLGEFRFGPDDSPWYGVHFASTDDAKSAHAIAVHLSSDSVPALLERGYELIAQTRMRPFATIDELGDYLQLLQGIRDSLDRFSPTVFERPLGEMILAHGLRRDAMEMTSANRRRLKTLAKEYVRPGVHVSEMHEALLRIQQQRTQWQRLVDAGVVPEVPLGLADVAVKWQRVHAELAELDAALGRKEPLSSLPLARLVRALAGLAAESEVFDNIVERAALRDELVRLDLESLLTELSVRHVPEDRVTSELELAWWQTLLERALKEDRSLLGANTAVVDRLERDFRLVDEAHASMTGPRLAWQLANQWKIAIVDERDEADRLRAALSSDTSSVETITAAAPELLRTLAPVWISSPYDVPLIPATVSFDTVLLVDSGAINLVEAAPAIRRARQVVAFGDPATQRPRPFHVAADPDPSWEPEVDFDDTSVFERLADIFCVATLTRSYRAGGEDLTRLINESFYGNEIDSLPWAGSYLGRGSLIVDYVEGGVGAPDPISGSVESPDAEVARVVTLAVEHALQRPTESLMVISPSAKHAERVRIAVTQAFSQRTDVAEFVNRETAEPFAVLTLEESVAESRDRVIFSLGFGLTKHGRVLSDFGELSDEDGERLLTVGMTRARRSMVIVSSIRPTAFDEGRLRYGAAVLMSILGGLSAKGRDARLEDLADPLTLALARELRRLGASVDVDYRGLLPLVAQHNGKAVVVEADPESSGDSLRESLRLRPHVLRRLGWHYARVHAFDLYTDPMLVATRIAGVLGIDPSIARAEHDTEPVEMDGH